MAPAYKVEELLALRDSVSESAVSFDKFGDEDAIKEHVLRPSVSANGIDLKRDRRKQSSEALRKASPRPPGLQSSANPARSDKKPSPSPSVKRGKAEKLLKEHGSPPGMRVTAGGRVVPTDIPPISSPRYQSGNMAGPNKNRGGYNVPPTGANFAFGLNGSRTSNAYANGTVITDGNNRYFQIYDGKPIALNVPSLIVPPWGPVGMNFDGQSSFPSAISGNAPAPVQPVGGPAPQTPAMDNPAAIRLERARREYKQKEMELRDLERREVIMDLPVEDPRRANVIAEKKCRTVELDNVRKQVKELEKAAYGPGETMRPGNMATTVNNQANIGPQLLPSVHFPSEQARAAFPSHLAPYGTSTMPAMPAFQQAGGNFEPFYYPGMFANEYASAYPKQYGMNGFGAVATPVVQPSANENKSPGSNHSSVDRRRSHAIEIRDPRSKQPVNHVKKSSLNPTSPEYHPSDAPEKRPSEVRNLSFPTDSHQELTVSQRNTIAVMTQKWVSEQYDVDFKKKESDTTLNTSDFFPNNPDEHSATKFTGPKPQAAGRHVYPTVHANGNGGPITPPVQQAQSGYPAHRRTPSDEHAQKGCAASPPTDARVPSWNRDCDPTAGVTTPPNHKKGDQDRSDEKPRTHHRRSSDPDFLEGVRHGLNMEAIAKDGEDLYIEGYIIGLKIRKNGAKLSPDSSPPSLKNVYGLDGGATLKRIMANPFYTGSSCAELQRGSVIDEGSDDRPVENPFGAVGSLPKTPEQHTPPSVKKLAGNQVPGTNVSPIHLHQRSKSSGNKACFRSSPLKDMNITGSSPAEIAQRFEATHANHRSGFDGAAEDLTARANAAGNSPPMATTMNEKKTLVVIPGGGSPVKQLANIQTVPTSPNKKPPSPAKVKLEQIAERVRYGSHHMYKPATPPDEKQKRWRATNWRKRFGDVKEKEGAPGPA
ncbi:hypothetical protein BDY21DRAFT_369249 [Lineolata rhizophorae]|uniref:Uncharacterized protein n=1 Tax=Lineolata rhizophorae TaxID=578093 RepID=A0A6A6PBI3_9PEZI|nr:hypothetical protein BDY21DRAFT_369249 [Lineolata rhizophorae]